MKTLLPILILSVFFAYQTERTTVGRYGQAKHQTLWNTVMFAILIAILAFPAGLRSSYNDTAAYIKNFNSSPTIMELLSDGDMHILSNPASEIYTACVRTVTDNYHIYFLIPAFFVQYAFVSTIRRYSSSFPLSIVLYICLGTYVFSFAAMKQTIAMAILMLAIPSLEKRRFGTYYLLVFLAFLFHTYALSFAILPLFTTKPWSLRTYILLFAVFGVMVNFEPIIGSFLDYANEQGKSVAEYEVFDNNQINLFRVAVYAVTPLLSLVLRRYLFCGQYDRSQNILIHMSIISFLFMLLGTINGANMFGRMGNYFEMGMVCSLPWIIDKAFTKNSAKLVSSAAIACFSFYFFYAYKVTIDFDAIYSAVPLWQFILSLF